MSDSEHIPKEGPRAYLITHDDHRGVLMCLALLFIGYALMIIGMRIFARYRTMGIDDYLAMVATVFSIIQSSTVIAGVTHHMGMSLGPSIAADEASIAKILRAADIILLISLFLAKAAVIWLCRRLFSINQKSSKVLCDVALGLSGVWCIGSILAISINCDAKVVIGAEGTCPGLVNRWIAVGAVDAIIEVFIFLLAVFVVWPLQMSFSRRISALSCFIVRLPILIIIAVHVVYLSRSMDDPNRGVSLVNPLVIRQTQLLFSLFSAAIPALNQYLRKFTYTGTGVYGTSSAAGHSYGLKSLTRNDDTHSRLRGENNTYTATVAHRGYSDRSSSPTDTSLHRHNSDDLIIRKDIHYEISYSDSQNEPVKRK